MTNNITTRATRGVEDRLNQIEATATGDRKKKVSRCRPPVLEEIAKKAGTAGLGKAIKKKAYA